MRCDQSHDVSTPLDRHRALANLRTGIIALHLNHATTPGLSVLAVVSWDTLKFAVPNRTHLFRSGQVDGSTGRTDPDGIVEHPHRETKYRPGPNPHWPVCHQIGPRFIHVCHLICSSGNFIYSHIWWDFILGFNHRTFDSATDQRGCYSDQRHRRRCCRPDLYTEQKSVNGYRVSAGGRHYRTVFG